MRTKSTRLIQCHRDRATVLEWCVEHGFELVSTVPLNEDEDDSGGGTVVGYVMIDVE